MMSKIRWLLLSSLLATQPLWAYSNIREDASAPYALVTWDEPVRVQAGILYTHMDRATEGYGNLKANIYDLQLGVEVTSWWLLYGQIGGSSAELAIMPEAADMDVGGLLGTRVNVWQVYDDTRRSAWRLTLQLDASYAYRAAKDGGSGALQWSEILVMLPVNYHLSLARTARNQYLSDFNSIAIFVAPVFSQLDGTWKLNNRDVDFEAERMFGFAVGLDFWLTERLSLSARATVIQDITASVGVRYSFP